MPIRMADLKQFFRSILSAEKIVSLPRVWTSGGAFALADQAIVSATNFLTGVIIGRICTKEEFGLYMLGLSIFSFATTLQVSLISTPFVVYSPSLKGADHSKFAGSSLLHQLFFSFMVVLLLFIIEFFLQRNDLFQGLSSILRALVAFISFMLLREFVRRVCFAGLMMKTAFILDLSIFVVQVPALLLLSHYGFMSARLVYCVTGSACGICSLVWLISSKNFFIMSFKDGIFDFLHNWKFGKWVFASSILWAFCGNLCTWALTAFHGTASTGVWAACMGIVALANPVITGGQNFLGPKLAHIYSSNGFSEYRKFVLKASISFLFVVAIFCVLLIISGDRLIVFVYGQRYAGTGLIVAVLALNLLATVTMLTLSRALFVIERADLDFTTNLIAFLILMLFGIWFIRSYGPFGAAIGLLVANTATSSAKCVAFVLMSRPVGRKRTISYGQ